MGSEGAVVIMSLVTRFVREDEGQDVIEYALLAAFLVVVVATIIQTVGTDLKAVFDYIALQLGKAVPKP